MLKLSSTSEKNPRFPGQCCNLVCKGVTFWQASFLKRNVGRRTGRNTCDNLAAELDAGICVCHELLANASKLATSVDADRYQSDSGSQATGSRNEVHDPNKHAHDHQNLPTGTDQSLSDFEHTLQCIMQHNLMIFSLGSKFSTGEQQM